MDPTRPVSIFLTDYTYQHFWDKVLEVAPNAMAVRLLDDGTLAGELDGTEVAFATSDLYRGTLGRQFFGGVIHTPSFRWMQSPAAGFDDPFYARFLATGAALTASHVNGSPIAEYVVHAVLDHTLGAPAWRENEQKHEWVGGSRAEVRGQTWTIVGYGSIGRAITPVAQALGVHVRGVRRSPAADDPADQMFTTARTPEALAGADVVVLAAPLDTTTRGMANDEFFAAMAPGSLLVNVGRGGLVDEDALLRALDRGAPGAAALDVTVTEPAPPDHPFWADPRITLTPHVSGSGEGNVARLVDLFVSNLDAYLRGEPMANVVRPAEVGLS